MSIIFAIHLLLASTATGPEVGPDVAPTSATKESVVVPKAPSPVRDYVVEGTLIGLGVSFLTPTAIGLLTCHDEPFLGETANFCLMAAIAIGLVATIPGCILGAVIGRSIEASADLGAPRKAPSPAVSLFPSFGGKREHVALNLLVQF